MRGGRRGRPSLLGTMARTAAISGTATAVSGNVARKQQAKAAAQAAPVQQAAPEPSEADQQIIEIQKFSALKDQGVITEEEFNAKKRQILGL